MDSFPILFLANEYLVSWIRNKNLTETLLWLALICVLVLILEYFKYSAIPLSANRSYFGIEQDLSESVCLLEPLWNVEDRNIIVFDRDNIGNLDQALKALLEPKEKDIFPVLGMDCEYYGEVPYLLQLANRKGFVLLIRIGMLLKIPQCLREVLSDDTIYKVGVEVYRNGDRMWIPHNIEVRGTLDLRYVVAKIATEARELYNGLNEMCVHLLHKAKPELVSHLGWNAPNLDYYQTDYAAADALAGVWIFQAACKKHFVEIEPIQVQPDGELVPYNDATLTDEQCRDNVRTFLDFFDDYKGQPYSSNIRDDIAFAEWN